jgi:Carboxypeptidase regulatory-like domain/TonB dependent receptor-like, beta-barrel
MLEGKMKRTLFVVLSCLILAGSVWAQAVSVAQITGAVKDQSGARLPGVDIKVTQTETGLVRSVVSDETGAYIIPNLPVGPYKLEASLPGFSTYIQNGIVLQVNSNPTVPIELQVGQVSEQVEVQADAAMVETHSTGIGQVIDSTRLVELPLNGRQLSQLITLSGAANDFVPTSAGQSLTSNKNYPTASAVSIAGGQGGQTLYLVDGGYNLDPVSNVGLPLPFPDAVREFKVETSSLPANYGTQPGGVVNVITRSGSNEFHGSAFEFVRNYHFNARNLFAPVRDSLKRNQFGGALGGPIVQNKLFFFAGYQGTLESVAPAANIAYIPTAATLLGDFTQIASANCNNGVAKNLGAPFSGNKVSQSALNPVALNYLKLIPVSTDPCGKFTYGIPNSNHEHQIVARGDWQMNDKHSLSARYFFTDYQHPQVVSDSLLTTTTDASVGLDDTVQTGVITHTFVINPNSVNTVHASASRSAIVRWDSDKVPTPTKLGSNVTQAVPNYVFFNISGYFTAACQNCSPGPWVTNSFQLSEDLNLIRGKHQISVGANWVHSTLNSVGNFSRNGNFTFAGTVTGNALADFMIGRPSSFSQNNGQIGADRLNIPSAYVQDNIRLSSHLTANVGLRWDPYLAPYQAEHHVSIFDRDWYNQNVRSTEFPNAPIGTLFDGDPGMPGHSYAFPRWGKFYPRVGLVYDPRGQGQETVRVGYGMFQGITPLFLQGGTHAPWSSPVSIPTPVGGLSDPYQGFPGGNPFPLPTELPKSTTFPLFGGGLGNFKLHPKPTYMQQWSLALQKQLPGDWLASASYLGNRTVHLEIGEPQNPVIYISGDCVAGQYGLTKAGPCSNTSNTNFRRSLYLADPVKAQYYANVGGFGDGGNANYNALLLSVQHRFTQNYTVNTNYTWSHCLTENEVALNGGGSPHIPTNRHAEYGSCLSDRTHAFNTSMVVKTPTFSTNVMQKIFGNWQESTIFTLATGTPFTVAQGTDNTRTGGGDLPNVIADPKPDTPTTEQWFNVKAFEVAPIGVYGNEGKNILRGPGAWNTDIALSRSFPIREGQSIDFRSEVFNVFNHPRLGNPNSTMNSPSFGQINSARDPRIMQFAVKYIF